MKLADRTPPSAWKPRETPSHSVLSVRRRTRYAAFGQITDEQNLADPTADPVDHIFGFTGRERDDESDLNFYRARYYDPAVGRFISQDPIGFSAGDANLYRYVGNGPTNWVDASGLAKGHHIVPQALWEGMNKYAQLVFDDYRLGARVTNRYYNFHNGLSMNGVSHACYIDAVRNELNKFLGFHGIPLSKMDAGKARQFLRHIQRGPTAEIVRFNAGALAEAASARLNGSTLYYSYRARMGRDAAYEKALKETKDYMQKRRNVIADLMEKQLRTQAKAGRKIASELGGKVLKTAIPGATALIVLCDTGDVMAAGREAFLDMTGQDLSIAGGQALGYLYDIMVEDIKNGAGYGGGRVWVYRDDGQNSNEHATTNLHGIPGLDQFGRPK